MSHRIEIDPEDIHVTFNDVKGVDNKCFLKSNYCNLELILYIQLTTNLR